VRWWALKSIVECRSIISRGDVGWSSMSCSDYSRILSIYLMARSRSTSVDRGCGICWLHYTLIQLLWQSMWCSIDDWNLRQKLRVPLTVSPNVTAAIRQPTRSAVLSLVHTAHGTARVRNATHMSAWQAKAQYGTAQRREHMQTYAYPQSVRKCPQSRKIHGYVRSHTYYCLQLSE